MLIKAPLEYVDETDTDEMDMPYLPWLEQAQLQIYEETKDLSPQESEIYWAKKRTQWQQTPLASDIRYLNGKATENQFA